ncbi:Cycloartenol synthase [Porphyridium purpureum]|uniref:Terpene cyclase/mutase family member n=1 Tax=Porphyridium purpureum TaxID=35688 RepID=A0A5J4Z8A0_PORPP|nr:Cycloartenol synthase [Porphyridium purpureum]|eukprot:POR9148..scf295_1
MWVLRCERGRQWWEYQGALDDGGPGADAEQQRVRGLQQLALREIDERRTLYAKNRAQQRHAGDFVLRTLAKYNVCWDGNPRNRDETDADLHVVPAAIDQHDPLGAAVFRGVRFFGSLQMKDGHWPGDYGGPMFLMPFLIFACHATHTPLGEQHKHEMARYIRNMQNDEGGWGLHIEHHATMFGTVLNYVALRLLNVPADDATCTAARSWIRSHGGATGIPSWGKFWLAVLNLYDWRGLNPLTPEMWCLPYWLPIHPGRYWCHARQVYLPMSYIYGCQFSVPVDDLILSLREELFVQPFHQIEWSKMRNHCCQIDEYFKRPRVQKLFWGILAWYEWCPLFAPLRHALRRTGLRKVIDHVRQEDRNTKWIDIGPVNKVINFLCCFVDNADGADIELHRDRLKDYLWLAEDGMKMQGYNGSQLWDTAFAVQAITESPDIAAHFPNTIAAAHEYLDVAQVLEDVPERDSYYRHISKGAWPFSTSDHGWPISDCSSEGLKATLALQQREMLALIAKRPDAPSLISEERLFDCVNVILSFQNTKWPNCDGGWATYELTRSFAWLELLNPSEIFGDIMIDYTYVECSSACITALVAFQRHFPHHRKDEIADALARGAKFINSIQRADGSWYGSWAVCFTYGTWFGVEALVATGHALRDGCAELRLACEFLLSKQNADDGSWGESYLSSQQREYSQASEGQVVNTAWALLSLCRAEWPDSAPLDRAASFLLRMQMPNGDWPQQLISGVFNRNCMITYINYRCVFSIWALGAYRNYLAARAAPRVETKQ